MKFFIFLFFSLLTSFNLMAACSSPTAEAGALNWFTSKFMYCDGTNWQDFGATGPTIEIINKTADEGVTSSTSLQDDDHLFFSLAANEVVKFELTAYIDTTAVPDFKNDWTGPAGASYVHIWSYYSGGGGGVYASSTDKGLYQTDYGTDMVSPNWATAGQKVIHIRGSIKNGTTAGTVQFRWAQNSSSANTTTVYAGSFIKVIRD